MRATVRNAPLWENRSRAVFVLAFAALLLAYGIYAALFIYNSSTVVGKNAYIPETRRYYVLFDDMMISMRYARNAVNGYGLVYNPGGARVEGFTDPLWIGYMMVIHGIEHDPAVTSLYVQATGACLLLLNLIATCALAWQVTRSRGAALGSVLFTAFYLPLNSWGLMGTAVSLLVLIITLAVWGGLRALERQRVALWPVVLLGAATWVRMDMAVAYSFFIVFMALADQAHRKRYITLGLAILPVFLISQCALRYAYYGELLPNTYYLKMTGTPVVVRVLRGAAVTFDFFMLVTPLAFLVLLVRRDRAVMLLAWMFAGQVLYNVWVGGDAWEGFGGSNRYLSIVMPLFFVLLWATFQALYGWIAAHTPALDRAARFGRGVSQAVLACVVVFMFFSYNAPAGHASLRIWALQEKPLYAGVANQRVQTAFLITSLTTSQATIAVYEAGVIPYFAAGRTFIDVLGRTDRHIARQNAHNTGSEFMPGHTKWDYDYSVRALQPDIVLEWWGEEITPYLDDRYGPVWFPPAGRTVYLLQDSPNILWDRLGTG